MSENSAYVVTEVESEESVRNDNRQNGNGTDKIELLESPKEKKERIWSLWIVYFSLFTISLGFSIVLTGIWPFLDKLDPSTSKEFLGLVVASHPLGQLIFSPLFGLWSNKVKSIRVPLIISLVIFNLSSALYASLESIPENSWMAVKYWMLLARFLDGAASGSIAVCSSYASAATTLSERTKSMSLLTFAQVFGFVIGPALQACFTPLGSDGFVFMGMAINMYTAGVWLTVLLGSINLILFLPYFFKDRRVAAKEQMILQGKSVEKETWKSLKLDYVSCCTLIFACFVIVFNFVLLEFLLTSLTMDQYAWTKAEALYYVGILMTVGGLIACGAFVLIGPLCKRYRESNVLIWFGFLLMFIGRVVYMPYRGDHPKLAIDREYITENNTIGYYDDDDPAVLGCPVKVQKWCATTPVLGFPEFIIGFILSSVSYPIGVAMIQTIFSKVLGSRPQGVWMGIYTSAGCLSRIVGPVVVGLIYTRYGTAWTFGLTIIVMIPPMILLFILRDRLDIKSEPPENDNVGSEC